MVFRQLSCLIDSDIQKQHDIAQMALREWLQTTMGMSLELAKVVSGRYASYNSYVLPKKVEQIKAEYKQVHTTSYELLNCLRVTRLYKKSCNLHPSLTVSARQELFSFIFRNTMPPLTWAQRKQFFSDAYSSVHSFMLTIVSTVMFAIFPTALFLMMSFITPSMNGLESGLDLLLTEYLTDSMVLDVEEEFWGLESSFDI